MPRGSFGLNNVRDISYILQSSDQTLGDAFGTGAGARRYSDTTSGFPMPSTTNFSEVPDISNILNEQTNSQILGGSTFGDFNDWSGTLPPGSDSIIGGRAENRDDFGTGVGPEGLGGFGGGPSFDVEPLYPGDDFEGITDISMPQYIQDIIDNFPREMPQSVRDAIIKDLLDNVAGTDSGLPDRTVLSPSPIPAESWWKRGPSVGEDTWAGRPPDDPESPVQYRAEPLELPEFTFADAATPPPKYVYPDLEALSEFRGIEYDPYARAPGEIPSVGEKPAGISDDEWMQYRVSLFNASMRGNESQTFDQWKYGFGDVRGRTQDLQGSAIRSLERSVRRSLGADIENPNVRRQTERATLGGFGMGLEDISGAARGLALSEYGTDFARAFETEERNYITELQQTGIGNVATLQEAQINYDRATKTYWQEEERRYDVKYTNWLTQSQEDLANWYAEIAADEQAAGTTTIIRTEGG